MKSLLSAFILAFFTLSASAQKPAADISKPDTTQKILVAEAACGECQLHLKGKDCDLAVRINGKAYFVDGVDMEAFGDSHAKDGFCKAISKAEVQGKIVNGRFKATYFKVIKPATK